MASAKRTTDHETDHETDDSHAESLEQETRAAV
jgi:hypothetical protein